MKNNYITFSLVTFLAVVASSALADTFKVANFFTDHMVLQRQQAIFVWGEGKPNTDINIKLANTQVSSKISERGTWKVSLPKMSAGGPYTMHIDSIDKKIKIDDILIGDVWVASGQSNMEWKVGWQIDNYQQEIQDSDYRKIRFFSVNTKVDVRPSATAEGSGWHIASPSTVADFSAAAWFFAKHNHIEKDVPVGVIESNVGGTPAQAWTPAETLLTIPNYRTQAKDMLDHPAQWKQRISQRQINDQTKWQRINSTDTIDKLGPQLPNYNDSAWQTIDVPFQQPVSDIVWLRKSFTLKSPNNTTATLFLGDINQAGKVFLNGELVEEEGFQDKTRIITLPKNLLKAGNNVLALRIMNAWDNKAMLGKAGEVWLKTTDNTINLSGEWLYSNTIEPALPEVERISWWPAGLYNAMIHPITQYPIKGVIWYQGESNVGAADEYTELFSKMITSWRDAWSIGDFPFIFAQLASFLPQKDKPAQSDWAELRQAQTDTLALKNTAMAVTIDIGNAADIHPRNKQDVGKRLWLAAKTIAYNDPINYSGPQFQSAHIKGKGLSIKFNVNSQLRIKGETLLGFEIAGNDGTYYNASAKIIDSQTVEVYSDKVSEPKSVRYAWADNSPANLYDSYDLPAVPFRYK